MKPLPGFPWHTTYPFQAIPRQRLFCPRPTKTRIIMEMDRQMEESICTLPTMQNQAVFICYPMNRDRLPGTAVELFRPASDQQEYCISTICADREGTLYYKNDSNYLMALETNGAYLNSVTATADTGKVTWPSAFRKDTLKYNLTVAENASKVTFALKAPEGCTITVNGQAYAGSFVADVSSGSTDIKVTVSGQGKSREYTFHISQDISTPVLANMTLSTSNTYSNTANRISLSPEFSSATTSYRAIYKESREFLNIFAEPADSSASVTAVGIRGTSKVTVLGKVTGSGAAHRIAMYFDKTNPEAEAEVKDYPLPPNPERQPTIPLWYSVPIPHPRHRL